MEQSIKKEKTTETQRHGEEQPPVKPGVHEWTNFTKVIVSFQLSAVGVQP